MKFHRVLRNIHMKPIYEELIKIELHFQYLSFQHVYKERIYVANQLSKMGVMIGDGAWKNESAKMISLLRMIQDLYQFRLLFPCVLSLIVWGIYKLNNILNKIICNFVIFWPQFHFDVDWKLHIKLNGFYPIQFVMNC